MNYHILFFSEPEQETTTEDRWFGSDLGEEDDGDEDNINDDSIFDENDVDEEMGNNDEEDEAEYDARPEYDLFDEDETTTAVPFLPEDTTGIIEDDLDLGSGEEGSGQYVDGSGVEEMSSGEGEDDFGSDWF